MSGLYLHIPFCRRKCPYCDFYSVPATDSLIDSYPELLTRHLAWAKSQGWTGPFDTVYFGGGTPSLLPPEAIAVILQTVQNTFGMTGNAEVSFEANPGTVTAESLVGYREAGVNRLSLGLQSCDDHQLRLLGRRHDRREGMSAVAWARAAGFDNLSLDLMFALPGQTIADLDEDLRCFLDLAPEHLSCYGLTAEPNTPFKERIAAGELTLPDDDCYAEAFLTVHRRLTTAGYEHYEIANYARAGCACRHNLGYWQRHPYLGIGAGAHSFCGKGWGSRWEVPSDLGAYRQALLTDQEPMLCLERFKRASALSETVYLALRTQRGVSDAELQRRFGCTLEEAFPEAAAACRQWLTCESGNWALNPAGWLLFDRLILHFL